MVSWEEDRMSGQEGRIQGRSFLVQYLGAAMMDSRCEYHPKMMPWIMAEIMRFSDDKPTVLMIKEGRVVVSCLDTERVVFESHVWDCVKEFILVSPTASNPHTFALIFKTNDVYLHCRLFLSATHSQVKEVLSAMKEAGKHCTGPGPSTSLQTLASLSSEALSFEVLYMGKLRMSCRKAPATFIDDAIEKFRAHEKERRRESVVAVEETSRRSSSQESESGSTDNLSALPFIRPSVHVFTGEESDRAPHLWPPTRGDGKENSEKIGGGGLVAKPAFSHPLEDVTVDSRRTRTPSGDSCLQKTLSLPTEPMRSRALSTGNEPRGVGAQVLEIPKADSSQSNRTMILLIGKSEMRIISPDAKSTLFSKHFRDIYHSAKGIRNGECFGFICREASVGAGFVAYVFSCQSESVATDILQVLKQAFVWTQERKERELSCEHCPMSWYCRLCLEVDGLREERVQGHILKRIEGLAEEDKESILAKFQGAEPQSIPEQNELLMMLLRAHCESKQSKHIHDTPENRHEFLHSYLGGGAIFMKAKRSLTNSFDQFVKKKSTVAPSSQPRTAVKEGSPALSEYNPTADLIVSDSPLQLRPRSSTIGVLSGEKIRCEIRSRRGEGVATSTTNATPLRSDSLQAPAVPADKKQHSPMMNIFMKVGPGAKGGSSGDGEGSSQVLRRQGSWRQAIFKRVVSPSAGGAESRAPVSPIPHGGDRFRRKRTSEEIRGLWKTAIRQQILLIRMEKQNYMLKEKQEVVNVKRNKLGYKELGVCDLEASDTWDFIISQANYTPTVKIDLQLLDSAILRGIPKQKRGQVWQLFIQQRRLLSGGRGKEGGDGPSYEQLLRSLTSHQHAILIDLGRTFPNHQFFSSPLGSGQLSLFNLLKAYSLLDPDVGYCQGLSFVAGLLLMHLEEEEAFGVLKYIMFELGAREHYKADMLGLQVKMYQLTRLIHDQDSDIHLLLYHNDVFPSLYAAPWFLTIFASQFPTGFAVRVLDLVMLHGVDVIAKFALVLILDRKEELMGCSGLEQVMDCFKHVLVDVSSAQLDIYLRKVLDMDLDKQLLTYAVEYSVMHDETFLAFLNEATCPPNRGGKGSSGVPVPADRLESQVLGLWEHVTKLEGLLRREGISLPPRPEPISEGTLLRQFSCTQVNGGRGQLNGSCDRISAPRLVRSQTLDSDGGSYKGGKSSDG